MILAQVKFKYADEVYVYPKLIAAVNILCAAKGKDALCTSGYRSVEKQKVINKDVLRKRKGAYQTEDGAVYAGYGKDRLCWASAYGKSNHNYCIAMDMDGWIEELDNSELKKYGLVKPMSHEPWHVQLREHSNLSQAQKEVIKNSVLKKGEVKMGKVFKDVDDGRWSAKHIEAAKELGLISGNTDGSFNPTGTLTREQAAVLMVNLYEKITGKKVL